MSQKDNRISDSLLSTWMDGSPSPENDLELVRLSAARMRAIDEASAVIARQLNGPLTALLLYMVEIKQHGHQFSQAPGDRVYLQQVVENALQQTERVCALVKQIADSHESPIVTPGREVSSATRHGREGMFAPGVMFSPDPDQRPLTKREREVLNLISEGCSNKQGAMRMQISPRTFESHRAEAKRKLGARNTADLVRSALLHPGAG
jgi:DNA-binding CsgD family transcriptional regulator